MRTMLVWFVFLVTLASLNTLNNWLPLALNMAGLPEQQAVRLTTLFQFGGVAGLLSLGIFADRIGDPRVLIFAFLGLAVVVAGTGFMRFYTIGLEVVAAGEGVCA